jgi:hypothetical protein
MSRQNRRTAPNMGDYHHAVINLRWLFAVLGATGLIAGLIALSQGVSLDAPDMRHNIIVCGSATTPNLAQADQADFGNKLGRTFGGGEQMFDETDYVSECLAKLSTRRTWGISSAIAGGVLLLGALVVRGRRQRPNEPTSGGPERVN